MMPIKDLTDVTLAIEDTDEDDEEDLTDMTLVSDYTYCVTRRSRSDSSYLLTEG